MRDSIPYPEKLKLTHRTKKITEEQKKQITHLFFTEELSTREISKKIGISHTQVWNICKQHVLSITDTPPEEYKPRKRKEPKTDAEKWVKKERQRVYHRRYSLRKRILGYAPSNLSLAELQQEYDRLTEYLPTITTKKYEEIHRKRNSKKRTTR